MTRERLPARRESVTFDLLHASLLYRVSFSLFPETMALAEIFVTLDKVGTPLEAVARDCMILASVALQHGATIEELRAAMTGDHDGGAASIAGAAIDGVAKIVAELAGDATA